MRSLSGHRLGDEIFSFSLSAPACRVRILRERIATPWPKENSFLKTGSFHRLPK
jgi:hypothetical protein